MLCRCILPPWASESNPSLPRVKEGNYSEAEWKRLNALGYNIYFLPNAPEHYDPKITVDGSHINTFNYVFIDMDLKEGKYENKEHFIETVLSSELEPNLIVDSGNGVHAYWQVSDLDAMTYLKLQRRLIRYFDTDEAVAKIYQLMRVPGSVNQKDPNNPKLCIELYSSDKTYTAEDLDSLLPHLMPEDEEYCKQHYDRTYNIDKVIQNLDDTIPQKFHTLIQESPEAKQIWLGKTSDRSSSDWRLGHIMRAAGFSRKEATSVLLNSAKAISRNPQHRVNYASNITDKIWEFETEDNKEVLTLSQSVKDILSRSDSNTLKGTRFPCHSYLDATAHGFRLSQIIGLVAGVGVGKTAMALNMFEGFVKNNPDYIHFFISLEQPAREIADRWKTMCGESVEMHEKVEVMDNYNSDGSFRHLSLSEIKDYILQFQKDRGKKVGCVVIDHIGVLKKKTKDGENQGIMDICHEMKAFANHTNTMLIMQSQSSREKAGVGDIELDKDAAYGTVFFESYCDYLITIWQPLKRCYKEQGCPTVTAFKFCKIRHKKNNLDYIKEDAIYRLYFDPETERLRTLIQEEETAFTFWNNKATNLRGKDRKTDLVEYSSITWVNNGTT